MIKKFRILNLASQRGASLIEYSLVCSLLILLAIPSVRKIAGFDQTLDKSLVNGNVEIIQGEMGSGLKGRFGDVVRGFENSCTGGTIQCGNDDDVF